MLDIPFTLPLSLPLSIMSLPYAAPAVVQEFSDQAKASDEEKQTSITPTNSSDATVSNVTLRTKVLILIAATLAHLVGNSFQLCLGLWLAEYVREYPQYSYAQLVSSGQPESCIMS